MQLPSISSQSDPRRASPEARRLRVVRDEPDNDIDEAVPGGPKGLRRRGKGPTYYFIKRWKKRSVKLSLGRSLPQARFQAQAILNAMDRGDFTEGKFREERTGIAEFFESALEALKARANLSPKSVAAYRSRIDHFLRFLAEERPRIHLLSEVTSEVAFGFVEWRRRQKVSRSGRALPGTPRNHPAAQTVHDDVRRLRGIFKVAVDQQRMAANPFAGVKVIKKSSDLKAPPRGLTEKEVRAALKAAREYDHGSDGPGAASTFRGLFHDMLHLYLLTGLRKEELIYLAWERVELAWGRHGRIHIEPLDIPVALRVYPSAAQAKRLDAHVTKLGADDPLFVNEQQMERMVPVNYAHKEPTALMALKAGAWDQEARCLRVPTRIVWRQKATQGRVPLTAQSRAILLRRRKANRHDSAFVFPHPRDGGPLRSDPLPIFKEVLAAAGLPKSVRLHDCRHTFGFTLRSRGVPLETLMGLMRHANIEETMVYARYSDEEGAKSIEVLNGFGI